MSELPQGTGKEVLLYELMESLYLQLPCEGKDQD